MLGLIAALPAVGLAFVAQLVLEKFTSTIKRLSGWGLFVFAIIFLVKGAKLRAAAKAEEAAGKLGAAASQDVSVEVVPTHPAAPAADSKPPNATGFTVGTPEERVRGETTGLTGERAAATGMVRCAGSRTRCKAPTFARPLPRRAARLTRGCCLCTRPAHVEMGRAAQARTWRLTDYRPEVRPAVLGDDWRRCTGGLHWLR